MSEASPQFPSVPAKRRMAPTEPDHCPRTRNKRRNSRKDSTCLYLKRTNPTETDHNSWLLTAIEYPGSVVDRPIINI